MNLYHSMMKGLREQRETRRQYLQQHSHEHEQTHEERKKDTRKLSALVRWFHRH